MATSEDQYRQYPPSAYSQPYQQQQHQQSEYSQQHQQSQYPQQQYSQQYPQQSQQYPRQSQQYPRQSQQQQNPITPPSPTHQRHQQKPSNHSRTFSFHSQKSHKSSASKDLIETHAEKESKRLHSKADPTLAMSEAEPSMIAAMSAESSWTPLRSMQHKDETGNAIGEPDLSNPTRNRWERPLDTIRRFEAAIDGGYSRNSMVRSETDHAANWNRRNSSFTSGQQRFANDAYFNNRPLSLRPDNSQYDMRPQNSRFDGQTYNNGYGSGPNRQRMSRMQTDSQFQGYGQPRNQHIYPLPHKDRSYETVNSAAGSGNSEQAGYQTDPTSSDNSSIDRTMPAKRHESINEYGPGPSYSQQFPQRRPIPSGVEDYGRPAQVPSQAPYATPASQQQAPPKQKNTLLRRTSTQQSQQSQRLAQPVEATEKRKSWFSRRFSKNA